MTAVSTENPFETDSNHHPRSLVYTFRLELTMLGTGAALLAAAVIVGLSLWR